MRVFVTGASGKLGSRVVKLLVARGDQVTGLGRNESSAAKVKSLGATAVQGSLTNVELMKSEASKVDAVIHTAFNHDDFSDAQKSCAEDRACIQALCEGLKASKSSAGKRVFLYSQGTPGSSGPLETDPKIEDEHNPRWKSEHLTYDLADDNLRTVVIRLAPITHSDEAPHLFFDFMVLPARKNGYVGYIDEKNVWPAAHYDDVAELFVLALDKPTPHPTLNAVAEEGISTKHHVDWVASQLGLPVRKVPQAEALDKLGFMGGLLSMNNPTSNKLTREWTGWNPRGPSLLTDLKNSNLRLI